MAAAHRVLKHVDHVAYAARTLQLGVDAVGTGWGISVTREINLPQFSLRSAMLGETPTVVEVVEFLSPVVAAARLGGLDLCLDHVAYEVDSIEQAAEAFEALGARFSGPDGIEVDRPIELGSGLHLWTQPGSSPLGFGLQFIERPVA